MHTDGADFAGLEPWDWRRIVNFKSRTRRVEFWGALALVSGVAAAGPFLDGFFTGSAPNIYSALAMIASAVLFYGASVNRMHDMGYAGWLVVLFFIPIANLVTLVWMGSQAGEAGPNEWGPPVSLRKDRTPQAPPELSVTNTAGRQSTRRDTPSGASQLVR